MAEVKIKNVCKRFAKVEVISNLSLEIPHGEFVVFVGPSGCGKSTTLRMIAGLEDVTAGRIELDGEDVTDTAAAKRGVAMVFQSYALFPHMTVAANIGFGLRLRKVERTVMDKRVKEVASILQITEMLERYPRELSGGQRQRVAIGRAIIRDPKVFLFDEPLSNLDATLRVQMRLEIARLHSELEATMIYVTHDQVEAMTLAERIVVLNHGKVEQVGTPMDLYDHPTNRFVAGFIGAPRMNFLNARQTKGELDIDGCRQPHRMDAPSTEVTEVGIRPEHLMPTDVGDAAFVGAVDLIERLGAESYAYIRLPGMSEYLTVRLPGKSALAIHETVGLNPDWAAIHLFSSSGAAV